MSSGDDRLLTRAVANNVAWCSQMSPGVSDSTTGIWSTLAPPPPLFPDLITTRPGVSSAAPAAATLDRDPCSVKDSFADVDLSEEGFRELFTAHWIGRDGVADSARMDGWHAVHDAAALRSWCDAAELDHLDSPALLASAQSRVLAARRGSAIVAGAVATFAHDVVGISNVFSVAAELPAVWQAIPAVVGRLWPGRPLVGYESGDDLDVALASGFTRLGPLRVWGRGLWS